MFLYLVDLTIGELTLNGVYVLGDELGDKTFLGRTVLNQLRVLLDGPRAVMVLLDAFHLDSSSVTDPICR